MELLKPALKSYTSCYATNLRVETIFLRKDYQVLLIISLCMIKSKFRKKFIINSGLCKNEILPTIESILLVRAAPLFDSIRDRPLCPHRVHVPFCRSLFPPPPRKSPTGENGSSRVCTCVYIHVSCGRNVCHQRYHNGAALEFRSCSNAVLYCLLIVAVTC